MQLIKVAPSGGQICNKYKLRYLVVEFAINASGAMLLPSLFQVSESISGSVVPLAMFSQHILPFAILSVTSVCVQ